ncbi:MAG: protein kinase domain-containing protein, partial [Jiangellaceae bacterium]
MDLHVSEAPVGRMVDGRYRVDATLARGGMATVYRALDTRLDRVVALKVMHPELAVDDEFVERFIGEARSAARLSHPAVVAVFDQGEDAGSVFLAMEYVEGRTLRRVLRDRGRLSPEHALKLVEPVLAALDAAHTAGIVHRDVKPENVLVGDDGRVKVADFGLARALSDASTATRGLLLGTVNYISPEQALGEAATPRSDVYSAGVMLYELLTGAPPHTGPTDFVIVRSHIDEDVPAPSETEPAVPGPVDELVRRSTTRDPEQRYADAGAFLAAVRGTRAALDSAVPGLEPRESAGVSIAEAMTSTHAVHGPGRLSDHTTVLPRTGVIPRPPARAR